MIFEEFEDQDKKNSEISEALHTLFANNVEPPPHIASAILELTQLAAVHDLICAKYRQMSETTGEEILKFFKEWKAAKTN